MTGGEERFSRTHMLLGDAAMERLGRANVTVVGLGAVGSYATEALARAGVGGLRLVDFDEVRASNINRQLLALDSTVGRAKADLARDRVRDIHPDCRVEAVRCFLDPDTARDLLREKPDVLVDAIDGVGPKTVLILSGIEAGVPVVSAMGAALHQDATRIRVDDLSKTRECRLARLIRKRLAGRGVRGGVRCVYSTEPVPHVSPDEAEGEPDFYERGRRRAPLGSLSTVTGIFGLMAAHEVLQILLGGMVRGHGAG